jgi:hypothetical protein
MNQPIASRLDGTSIVRSPDVRGLIHLVDGDRALCGTELAIIHDTEIAGPFTSHCWACVHALRESEGEARPGAAS